MMIVIRALEVRKESVRASSAQHLETLGPRRFTSGYLLLAAAAATLELDPNVSSLAAFCSPLPRR